MTETLLGVSPPSSNDPADPPSAEELAAAKELVRQARAQGVALTGPGGLLKALTKTVLETALEEEMAVHLGCDKHDPAGRNRGNFGNGKRGKTVLTDSGEAGTLNRWRLTARSVVSGPRRRRARLFITADARMSVLLRYSSLDAEPAGPNANIAIRLLVFVVTRLYLQSCLPRLDRRHLPSDVPPTHSQNSMLDKPHAIPAAARALCRAPALPMEEPLVAPRDDLQSYNGSGWRVTSPTSLPSTPSTRSPSFPTPAAPTRSRPRSSGAVGAMAELPTTGIGPTGIAVTLAPLGALLVLVTTVTLAVFKPWGQTRFQRH
jgi:hypothetical protein